MTTWADTETEAVQLHDKRRRDRFTYLLEQLATHPDAGDVVPKSGGCRKVRWSIPGRGKRGGVRVIYFNRLADGHIWLLVMYAKNARATIDGRVLAKIRETIDG